MIGDAAKAYREIERMASDVKKIVPKFLMGEDKIKDDYEYKYSDYEKHSPKEAFTEYQKEIMHKEYSMTDEDIAAYDNWEQFEKEKWKGESLEADSLFNGEEDLAGIANDEIDVAKEPYQEAQYESKEDHDLKGSDETGEKLEVREGLTDEEKQEIKKEMGWSDEIINHIENMDQYNVYKEANLHEEVIDGRKCLVKDIDMDYVDPKSGKTNRELMESGRSPIDSKTGEKIELHHMGQAYDSPFAELCENSEHGDGKHAVLHTNLDDSWRKDPALERKYNNVDRPIHWKERAQEA